MRKRKRVVYQFPQICGKKHYQVQTKTLSPHMATNMYDCLLIFESIYSIKHTQIPLVLYERLENLTHRHYGAKELLWSEGEAII